MLLAKTFFNVLHSEGLLLSGCLLENDTRVFCFFIAFGMSFAQSDGLDAGVFCLAVSGSDCAVAIC